MSSQREPERKESASAPEAPRDQETAGAEAAELSRLLAEKEAEREGLFQQLLRLKAEFENYRKRVDREKPELVRHGRVQLLERLLPLYDVLLAAHQEVVRQSESGDGGAVGELARGLEMIFKEFTKLFQSEGVAVIESVGRPYDFERHEVLGSVETGDHPDGTVVEELQKGYLLDGRVLRPAKVRVARKKG